MSTRWKQNGVCWMRGHNMAASHRKPRSVYGDLRNFLVRSFPYNYITKAVQFLEHGVLLSVWTKASFGPWLSCRARSLGRTLFLISKDPDWIQGSCWDWSRAVPSERRVEYAMIQSMPMNIKRSFLFFSSFLFSSCPYALPEMQFPISFIAPS